MTHPILIIGSGPTGLGAAWRLQELGHDNWLILEQQPQVGGLAASFQDEAGFTWDLAVHVAHSHYHYVDQLLDTVLPGGFLLLERRSWVRTAGDWIPYPFQYNIRHLSPPARQRCLDGLQELRASRDQPPPANFQEWIYHNFGDGIAEHFMVPYNRKIWSTDLATMDLDWLGDRVPVADVVERVERNVLDRRDDVAWGPNHRFRFPRQGGTGAIWKAMAARLPTQKIRLNIGVERLDVAHREALLSDGNRIRYDALISTMPLPRLVQSAGQDHLAALVGRLRHTHVQVVCLACEFPLPDSLREKTWLYCPDGDILFYRVTPFSLFSPSHVPDPQRQCSFLCEVSTPGDGRPWPRDVLEEQTLRGFASMGLAPVNRENTRFFHLDAPYGYPVPTLGRDAILHEVLPQLDALRILSRGRFGCWKYEVANMDHSIMQGVEAVNRLLLGEEETTWRHPRKVNSRQ